MQKGLQDVLADPTLELLLPGADGAYLTVDGRTTTLESQPSGRVVTHLAHEGRTVGALVHSPSVLDDPTSLGELAAVIGLLLETDRINEALRRQRDLLSAIGDGTPALLCLIFESGEITPDGTNRAGRELLGATTQELAGQLFWEAFVVAADRPAVELAIGQVVAGRPQSERVSRWRTVTGAASVAWTCTPLPEVGSDPVFLISGVDVTERERQAQELRDSRSRIVLAADTERRRLERNLHDGAQQRLVSLSLSIRLAERKVLSSPQEVVSMLGAASQNLAEAIAELRELARGLHPVILTDHGLGAALRALAERAPLPVAVRADLPGRLPAPVEAAAYFIVAEALTNAVKHGHANDVVVSAEMIDGALTVAIVDDGIGGAALEKGTGLRGLNDRVEAISGQLTVTSDARGTSIIAAIPAVGATQEAVDSTRQGASPAAHSRASSDE